LSEYFGQKRHLECFYDFPDKINSDDADKNPDCGRTFYQVIDLIKQDGKQDDINDINYTNIKKTAEEKNRQSVVQFGGKPRPAFGGQK
jgi:hypothetical protein